MADRPTEPGFYRDPSNGDLWRLDVLSNGRRAWTWVNGNRWTHVPEGLERVEIA